MFIFNRIFQPNHAHTTVTRIAGENSTTWVSVLPEAEFVCNNAFNATTQLTPFQALMEYSLSIGVESTANSGGRWLHSNA
jgi:hypothetical protein